jgi:hypothetical protein
VAVVVVLVLSVIMHLHQALVVLVATVFPHQLLVLL